MNRSRILLPLAVLAAALLSPSARGQVDGPEISDVRERSGLFTRIVPIEPRLPVDKDRDLFYNSKWLPRLPINRGRWVNSWKDGGLYGRQLPGGCTSCRAPFFQGMPGAPAVPAECAPHNHVSRILGNFVHPFKPVDTYYSGGCYVPVYDLDPFVPGPGWFPWWVPDLANIHTGG
ncbi:hypothetical protein [Tautonia sociabilis]|uniref:Uncharacterized protein n=1 Tax=Tautonia sociabilis TaxID=2080755 RepID=A0A432MHK0_9BACT|nr:hypothetical protein [Tautonia sociabilis]RUL86316.1 hypothetical protein TsocGM_16440 [Tautonia sociabilis]